MSVRRFFFCSLTLLNWVAFISDSSTTTANNLYLTYFAAVQAPCSFIYVPIKNLLPWEGTEFSFSTFRTALTFSESKKGTMTS